MAATSPFFLQCLQELRWKFVQVNRVLVDDNVELRFPHGEHSIRAAGENVNRLPVFCQAQLVSSRFSFVEYDDGKRS